MAEEKTYIAIDLKSFYASVECRERGLDPLTANLVVADASRTEKTICLAVSPGLKRYGIPGRARLFEVVQRVKEVNTGRLRKAPGGCFTGKSCMAPELDANPALELDYIVATPRMAYYMDYSTRIYGVYLKYVAPEDVHVYSIDEVFIDATAYLRTTGKTARQFAMEMILDVLESTGITATAGIAPNLFLCKVAMDVEAKHIPADKNGVRIAELTERSYRERLWDHRPLTDFWRVGPGYARKLEAAGMYTMGDIALRSTYDENCLYELFGINAELLIDHAWGREPCTIREIKAYKPATSSISSGQVLQSAYSHDKGRLIVHEMTDLMVLDLVDKGVLTDQIGLTVVYDTENLTDPARRQAYSGAVAKDRYGREAPKPAHGTVTLKEQTSSTRIITEEMLKLYDRITDPALLVRRVYVTANRLVPESEKAPAPVYEQTDLFTDYDALQAQREAEEKELAREKRRQQAILSIKSKYGKNAILKGMNLEEGATTVERNAQVGGHKA